MRALLDLLFPVECAGCGASGDVACDDCRALLRAAPQRRMPTPCPAGLPPVFAVADYDGAVRHMVLAYKERGATTLAPLLAAALARSVAAAAVGRSVAAVVPVPSTAGAVRDRGFDPLRVLARSAVGALRPRPVVADAVRHRRAVADSAGLSAAQRACNLRDAFQVDPRRGGILADGAVVVVDDVVTTGATGLEVTRALRAVGVDVVGIAAIAATRRQGLARRGLHKTGFADYGSWQPNRGEEAAWTSS